MKKGKLIIVKPGGFFKHAGLVYQAESKKRHCDDCCFLKIMPVTDEFIERDLIPSTYCDAPESLICTGLIFSEVTKSLEKMNVELVDSKTNIFPWLIAETIAFWAIIATVLILISK